MGAGFQATTPSLPYATAMFTLLILKPGTPTETISLSSDIHRPWKITAMQKEPDKPRDTQTHQGRNKKAGIPNLNQLDGPSSPGVPLLRLPFPTLSSLQTPELISGYETWDSEILRASITP